MNRVQRISHRATWCQLKRLQSSASTSNSQIRIPIRIKRGPTDILRALANTVPNDPITVRFPYHDDPFLLPLKTRDYRNYSLSYESGKKTAMWIYKEHRDLFPKYLAEPEIEAFTLPATSSDKNQISEETLLNAISRCKISDALRIYKLLGDRTSKKAKQALFELLCYYNDDANVLIDFPYERWFMTHNSNRVWRYTSEIDELYQSLAAQDFVTATAAHNIMICCLSRYLRVDEAWSIYQECMKNNVPLYVTTYNYILLLLPEIFGKQSAEKVHYMLSVLQIMNEKRIKPNVRTLNAALKLVSMTPIDQARDIVKHLIKEFRGINIKLSLASYYHVMNVFMEKESGMDSYKDFVFILNSVEGKSFTIQDPEDNKFFARAMQVANNYTDRKAADTIHNLLLTGNNQQFISDATIENAYYSKYISVLLSTSSVDEFFKHYVKLVPHVYVPTPRILEVVIGDLETRAPKSIMEYIPRLFSDITLYCTDRSLQFSVLRLMRHFDKLPIDSPLSASFADAALTCATNIKSALEKNPATRNPIAANVIGCIATILILNNRPEECVSVLTSMVSDPNIFIPVMSKEQTHELFLACISKECIEGALLVLEYSVDTEFPHTTQMARKLYNLPQLTSIDRDKLINLIGAESLNTSDTS